MGPSFDLTHLSDYHSTPEHLGYGCELSAPLRRNILTEAIHPGRHHSNHCMRYFMTGGLSKEHGPNKPSTAERTWERSKGDTTCPTTSQNPSRWHPSWLSSV